MLKRLARDDDIRAFLSDLAPIVRIGQDDIDIGAGCEIDADISPRRQGEKRPVTAVDVLTAEIKNDQRLGPARLKLFAAERRHLVERALVHLPGVNARGRALATALSKSGLAFSP